MIDTSRFISKKDARSINFSPRTLDMSIRMLFNTTEVSDEAQEQLARYAVEKFQSCRSVTLYVRNINNSDDKFSCICKKNGLNPEEREVIITGSGDIWYSDSYRTQPDIYKARRKMEKLY